MGFDCEPVITKIQSFGLGAGALRNTSTVCGQSGGNSKTKSVTVVVALTADPRDEFLSSQVAQSIPGITLVIKVGLPETIERLISERPPVKLEPWDGQPPEAIGHVDLSQLQSESDMSSADKLIQTLLVRMMEENLVELEVPGTETEGASTIRGKMESGDWVDLMATAPLLLSDFTARLHELGELDPAESIYKRTGSLSIAYRGSKIPFDLVLAPSSEGGGTRVVRRMPT